jgi:hypothetical protein
MNREFCTEDGEDWYELGVRPPSLRDRIYDAWCRFIEWLGFCSACGKWGCDGKCIPF